MVWVALAFMTAAAVLCVAWPLLRPRAAGAPAATDVGFYRDQVREIDADVGRGLLRPEEAEATRAELGRRLLAAAERSGAPPAPGPRRVRAAALSGLAVAAIAGGLYARVGQPRVPDEPLAARVAARDDFAAALAKFEGHLAAFPDDGRGFEKIAPVYMRMGRFDAAARAYREAIRVLGPTASRRSALGQALVLLSDGVVTAAARAEFDAALKEDPSLPQARFFAGLAAAQDGDAAAARDAWTRLLAETPPGPTADLIAQRLAELDGGRGAPAAGPPDGAAAVAALPADQQRLAIRGMVDGLAGRLARDGGDAEGWLRLVRAYRVLGEPDLARKALGDARRAAGRDAAALGRLDALARDLGLEG